MNCRVAQELIPLYVGHDLDEAGAAKVAEHLGTCAECPEIEREYSETIWSIRQSAPPEFGEAVYAGIRRRVMDDISRQTASPSLVARLTEFLGSYARLASATAAVVAIGMAAFYFVGIEKKTSQLAAADAFVLSNQVRPSQTDVDAVDPVSTPDIKQPAFTRQGTAAKPRATRRHQVAAETVKHVSKPKKAAAPETLVAQHQANVDSGSAKEETLRVEMQTSDPNIRIIWFANTAAKPNFRN